MARAARTHGSKARSLHRKRGTSKPGHPFYLSSKWRGVKGLRTMHLAKQPFCVVCKEEGKPFNKCIPEVAIVDHIRPHRGRPNIFFDPDNLQTMCKSHHSKKTIRDMGGFGQ